MGNDFLYFPMFLNMENKQVYVFGMSKDTLSKIELLLKFHASVTVFGKTIPAEEENLWTHLIHTGHLRYICKEFSKGDITEEADLVIAATQDAGLNEVIGRQCQELKIPVEVMTNPDMSTLKLPSVVTGDGIVAGVAGNQEDLVKKTVQTIKSYLEEQERGDEKNESDILSP